MSLWARFGALSLAAWLFDGVFAWLEFTTGLGRIIDRLQRYPEPIIGCMFNRRRIDLIDN